jgi:hypothetical protein
MPDTKKFKSVAVPISAWEELLRLADINQRSVGQEIAVLVDCARSEPTDIELRQMCRKLGNLLFKGLTV